MKRYNTPQRHWVIKTRLTEEEYAEFAERVFLCKMSQAEFIRQALVCIHPDGHNHTEMCDDYITQARLGEPYDVDHLPQEPFDPLWKFIISLGIGFLAALVVTGIMKGELKTVGSQARADDYVKRGSMNLTKTNDLWLLGRRIPAVVICGICLTITMN